MEQEPLILKLTPDAALARLRERGSGASRAAGALGARHCRRAGRGQVDAGAAAGVGAIGPDAAYVPMDGFHMKHSKLEALGTAADKGMPHTFEGAAFAEFLAALKAATGPVNGPGYSRKIEDVVDDAFTVPASAQVARCRRATICC